MNNGLAWAFVTLALCARAGAEGPQPGQEAWFGQPQPRLGGRSPELIFRAGDFPSLPVVVAAREGASTRLRGPEIFQHVKDLVAISEQTRQAGEALWGRIPGRLGDRLAAEYLHARLEEFGLSDVHIDEAPVPPQWWPTAWEARLLGRPAYGRGTVDYVFRTAMPQPPSRSTGPAGLEAELVYAGQGREADLIGRDLRNKVAVIRARPVPGAFSTGDGVARRLGERGAVGMIAIMDWPVDLQLYLDLGLLGTEQITVFAIAATEGEFLEGVLSSAAGAPPPRIRLRLTSEMSEGLRTHNVVGSVPGRGSDVVIVNAHHDAYFYGANDNASGVATLLALARQVASSEKPRHSYVFVATGSHHNGHAGALHFIENHRDLLSRCLIVLNAEHTASRLEVEYAQLDSSWGSEGGVLAANTETPKIVSLLPDNPVLLRLFREAIERYGVTALSEKWSAAPGDVSPYSRLGYPVVQLIEVGRWYHTTADIPSAVSVPGLERTARAFADFLADLDRLSGREIRAARSGSSAQP